MMQQLLLVRHAQTEENQHRRLQGQRDTPLSDMGLRQAQRVAEVLRGETIDALWTSPLQRARHTAEQIQRFHDCPMTEIAELMERNFGEFEGRPVQALFDAEAAHSGDPNTFKIPGGESMSELRHRVDQFWQACRKSGHRNLVLVGHAGFFRALIGRILSLEFAQWSQLPQANTCLHRFRFNDDGEITAWQLNDHEHCL